MKTNRILIALGMTIAASLAGVAILGHSQQPPQPSAQPPAPVSPDLGDVKHADETKFYKKPGYSPYAGRVFPQRPLWGDQHVHTGWSMDAGVAGATLGPEESLRFARGEEVTASSGQPAKLSRPLDWVVISDHSDVVGIIEQM